jgi:hypothetical protein
VIGPDHAASTLRPRSNPVVAGAGKVPTEQNGCDR